jgi:hypothetical protein
MSAHKAGNRSTARGNALPQADFRTPDSMAVNMIENYEQHLEEQRKRREESKKVSLPKLKFMGEL